MTSDPDPRSAAVLVAAGRSTRMAGASGPGRRKPLLAILGRTVLEHAAAAFDAVEAIEEIVIVGHADDLERLEELRARSPALRKVARIVAGGAERSDSVRAGVLATSGSIEVVAIHDAARPLVLPATIRAALRLAAAQGASVVAVPVSDTIKSAPGGTHAERTLDRSVLWAAQTPQCFRRGPFTEILEQARREGVSPTDDAALHERYVGPVAIARGLPTNLKVTTPDDLVVVEALLRARAEGG